MCNPSKNECKQSFSIEMLVIVHIFPGIFLLKEVFGVLRDISTVVLALQLHY